MKELINSLITDLKAGKGNLLMYVASGAEDFFKVWAEYKYDALAKTKYFQKLQDMEMKKKLVLVATMFAVNGHFKIKMTDQTPWTLFLKGVVTDFFPEMGKRLINGDSSPDPEVQEVIEVIRHEDGRGEYFGPKNSPGSSGKAAKSRGKSKPGFCAGFLSTFEDRMKDTVNKKKGGSQ